MFRLTLLIFFLLKSFEVYADVVSLNNRANEYYRKGKYDKALKLYTDALKPKNLRPKKGPEDSAVVHYNAANTLTRVKAYDKAIEAYKTGETSKEKRVRAAAYYGEGWVHFQEKRYEDSLKSFIETLRLDPNDKDAKRNLEIVLRKMQEQKSSKQKDESEKNKEKQNKDSKANQQKTEQKDSEQQKKEEFRQVPGGMSKEEAERLLEALSRQEKENLEKNKKKLFSSGGYRYVEKDW